MSAQARPAQVVAAHRHAGHAFSKHGEPSITLLAGLGVQGDAHCGVTVRHRSRVAKDPTQPNLRQVHLLHDELLHELRAAGFEVQPGQMGENVTTRGIDLLALAAGTELRLGADAVLRITGLRNPCAQIEAFRPGLLAAVLDRTADGALRRKAGVMAIVLRGGAVEPGSTIALLGAPAVHVPLRPV